MRDPWARPHEATVPLDGEPRALQFARLGVGEMANVKLLLAIFRQQQERIVKLGDVPVAQQLDAIAEERTANLRMGQWVEETLVAGVRPVTPWTSAEGVEVTDGASLVAAYQDDDLVALLMVLFSVNTVRAATAKNSESPRDSSPGSVDASPAARGDAPAPTAAVVAPSGSATPADAAAPTETSPSGSTTAAPHPSPSSALSAA